MTSGCEVVQINAKLCYFQTFFASLNDMRTGKRVSVFPIFDLYMCNDIKTEIFPARYLMALFYANGYTAPHLLYEHKENDLVWLYNYFSGAEQECTSVYTAAATQTICRFRIILSTLYMLGRGHNFIQLKTIWIKTMEIFMRTAHACTHGEHTCYAIKPFLNIFFCYTFYGCISATS